MQNMEKGLFNKTPVRKIRQTDRDRDRQTDRIAI